jgi:hypothetical protein
MNTITQDDRDGDEGPESETNGGFETVSIQEGATQAHPPAEPSPPDKNVADHEARE